ncbi:MULTISPECIES: hypothetical protein [unclassified Shewanella]|uniref:hypothetical protein n=1 Tax=unclassified Shewanella TaxID=196818 RepID=UPI000C860B3A|nr:hypothetical protein [Shewanella sp. 10N.286.51.B7]PMG70542.1 hypothetical protein BCU84_02935 [Shewanella sp. 10N.286.51.B7]
MKKLSIIITILTGTLLSPIAFANNAEAPKETLISLTDACTKMASEEQIDSIEKQQFVSDCVNAQLIEMGYQRQEAIAKTNLSKENL